MRRLPNLRDRCRLPEIMDQPGLERGRHFHALRGLERLNRWSGSVRVLWPPIRDLARQTGGRSLRLLDLATGGGDVPVGLWHKARRAGLALEVAGCDLSPQAVEYAGKRAVAKGADVRFFQLDALGGDLPAGYDVLTSSLFLHHLEEPQAVSLLRHMSEAAGQMVLINDLVRNLPSFLLVYVASRLLTGSPVVHVDGPLSIQAAFTVPEARELAEKAGLTSATVERRYPARFLLTWKRP